MLDEELCVFATIPSEQGEGIVVALFGILSRIVHGIDPSIGDFWLDELCAIFDDVESLFYRCFGGFGRTRRGVVAHWRSFTSDKTQGDERYHIYDWNAPFHHITFVN